MKIHLFALILTFASFDLFSQDLKGSKVLVRANTSVSSQEYFIETYCGEREIKIIYTLKDSICYKDLNKDSVFFELSKIVTKWDYYSRADSSQKKIFNQLDSVIKKYTIYSKDSINFSYGNQLEYEELLNILFSSTKTELENEEKNKNRIVLDGTAMRFTFLVNDVEINEAQAHSPTATSHSLLFNYIKSSLDIYRQKKKNNFLSKERTSGY